MKKFWAWLPMIAVVVFATFGAAGCGHTDEEMAAKQREIDKLAADLKAAKAVIAEDQSKYGEAQNQIDKMREQLKQAGINLEKSAEDAARLKQALAEYKQRADQLAVIEARFRELRSKLDKLNQIGVKVVQRNNKLVIQLPGDILFDTGKEDLKPQGKEVLGQVADVIRGDKDLNNRFFLVAGHTDNQKVGAGSPYRDNWQLSLARARQVLVFLVNKYEPAAAGAKKEPTGGGLNPQRWAAAGYGDTDPIAGTIAQQAKDQQDKNRRVELVVQPNVEEMLNLNNIR